MAVQLNPYAGQVQSTVVNPFQQRNDASKPAQEEDFSARVEGGAPRAQISSRRDTESDDETRPTPGQRGSLLDVKA